MTKILLPADSHYGTPEVLDLCDSLGLRYAFSLSKNARLREHVQTVEVSTSERYARKGQKLRRFKTFFNGARSWTKDRRVIARVGVGLMGRDTRYTSPISRMVAASIFTKSYTSRAARLRTTSRAGKAISPRTGRLV
jgi:hypothetical protein